MPQVSRYIDKKTLEKVEADARIKIENRAK